MESKMTPAADNSVTWLPVDSLPVTAPVVDPDAVLMCQVAEGDEAALRQLIQTWQNPLLNFFHRSLHSRAEAEDLAQVVFIKLYRASPRYRPEARFSTYLFHIARRVLLNEIRRRKRKPAAAVDPNDLHSHRGGDVRSELRLAEIEEMFARCLPKMPEKHRNAIILLKQKGLSYEEIADAMNTRASVVKTWIFRAREVLRKEAGRA